MRKGPRTIPVAQYRKLLNLASCNPLVVFNADFAAAGSYSATEHAHSLLPTLQAMLVQTEDPILVAGSGAFSYLQLGGYVSGFLLRSNQIVYVGELSQNRAPITFTREERVCQNCGTSEAPSRGICVRCKTPYHMAIGGVTIPIYSTTLLMERTHGGEGFFGSDHRHTILVSDNADEARSYLLTITNWNLGGGF